MEISDFKINGSHFQAGGCLPGLPLKKLINYNNKKKETLPAVVDKLFYFGILTIYRSLYS